MLVGMKFCAFGPIKRISNVDIAIKCGFVKLIERIACSLSPLLMQLRTSMQLLGWKKVGAHAPPCPPPPAYGPEQHHREEEDQIR